MDLTKYPMDKQTCTLQLESCKLQLGKRLNTEGGRQAVGGLGKREDRALALCVATQLC